MSKIAFVRGNLLHSSMQTLTNAINTRGVMGAGIAKAFKNRFPAMFDDYAIKCKRHSVRTGKPYLWRPADDSTPWVSNFPTKNHWRDQSKMEWIEEGFRYLTLHYSEWSIRSLAVPALGCGLGGLKWEQVRPTMEHYLEEFDIPVEIYVPYLAA